MKKEKERLLFRVMLVFCLIKATIGRSPAPIAKPGCQQSCGNVAIPYPFGIGSDCSANHTFTITCNTSKPFLNSINLEVLEIQLDTSTIRVNSPVNTSDCPKGGISSTGPRPYLNLSATPFSFNNTDNVFIGIGCGSVAQLFDDTTNQGTAIVECLSRCSNVTSSTGILESGCYGINCCLTQFPPISSKVVTVSFSSIDIDSRSNNTSRCNYGFLVEANYWLSNFMWDPFDVEASQNVPLVLDWTTDENCYYPKLCKYGQDCNNYQGRNFYGSDRMYCSCRDGEGNAYLPNGCPSVIGKAAIAKSGCQDVCGNVTIPYPFGIGSNCSANHTFTITCNTSKPFLNSINLEVLEIRLWPSTIRVNSPVTTSDCPMGGISSTGPRPYLNLSATPFSFNNTFNILTGIGCGSVAQLFEFDATTNQGTEILECVSRCSNATTTSRGRLESGCNGIDCCQKTLPPISSKVVNVSLSSIDSRSNNTSGCNYGFLVEEEWFSNLTDPFALEGRENVPLVLDWTTDEYCFSYKVCGNGFSGSCEDVYYPFNIYGSDRKYCACGRHYEGNAYLPNGCQSDIDNYECENSTMCDDNKICNNYHRCDFPPKSKTVMFAIVGISSGLGGLFLITGAWWLWKIIKRRKKAKLKKKFFKRNGGLLLQQQLTSAEQGYVEKTKVFTSKELEKATDGYSENRILGHGGQGTVYKGMLTDGKIVAIKKSKIVDEEKLEEFINEVVILSQINHRNVVKLHGCCLETEVPMLVYDFIPNGTLFQYIHHKKNEDFPLSWDVRLRIASEVAEALSYLHSAASQPIYHRDVKSTNILLDDKYRAKVADFGTSRSTDIDQTHMTTRVQGTFGYLDPEYFQSSQFTAKSDVYSFGVVLLELLTGQKAVLPITFEEGRSLATYFMFSMTENRLFDILDSQVLEEGGKEEINGVANLARRCLNLNGKKRPTMKEVAMELEAIRISSRASPPSQEHCEDVNDHSIIELARPWDTASTSITSSVEDKPLLFN